jgi:hypothetical protein
MINSHFFEKADHFAAGSEGVDIQIEDFQQIGNDNGLQRSIE